VGAIKLRPIFDQALRDRENRLAAARERGLAAIVWLHKEQSEPALWAVLQAGEELYLAQAAIDDAPTLPRLPKSDDVDDGWTENDEHPTRRK